MDPAQDDRNPLFTVQGCNFIGPVYRSGHRGYSNQVSIAVAELPEVLVQDFNVPAERGQGCDNAQSQRSLF